MWLPWFCCYFLLSVLIYIFLIFLYQVESCCVEIIRRVKNYFGWLGEVNWMNHDQYAWIGKLPSYLNVVDGIESNAIGTPSISKLAAAGEEDMKTLQDIASYQVIFQTSAF